MDKLIRKTLFTGKKVHSEHKSGKYEIHVTAVNAIGTCVPATLGKGSKLLLSKMKRAKFMALFRD